VEAVVIEEIESPPYVILKVLSDVDLTPKHFAGILADAIWGKFPQLAPQWLEVGEQQFSYSDREDLIDVWGERQRVTLSGTEYFIKPRLFWWREKELKCYGNVSFFKIDMKQARLPSLISINSEFDPLIPWNEIFLGLCSKFNARVAQLHVVNGPDFDPNGNGAFSTNTFGNIRDPKVYGFGWMFAAGGELYPKLMSADLTGLRVERSGFGSYCVLRIAKDAQEIIDDFPSFDARRKELIKRLPIISEPE
jgi:hypothetical protein